MSNDAVHLNTLKTLLRLSTVLLDHWKWILSGAIKVRATQVLSKYKGFSIVFPKILDAIERYEGYCFSDSSLHSNFQYEQFRFRLFQNRAERGE